MGIFSRRQQDTARRRRLTLPGSTGRDEGVEVEAQLLEGSGALLGHGTGFPIPKGLPVLPLLAHPQAETGGVLLGDVGMAVGGVVAAELLEPLIPAAMLGAGGSLAAAGVELPIEGDGVEQPDALVVHGGGLAVGTLAVLGPLGADPPAQLGVVLDGDVARSLLGLPEGELGEALLPRGVAVALLAERGTASRAGSGTGRNGLSGEATLGGLLLYKSKVQEIDRMERMTDISTRMGEARQDAGYRRDENARRKVRNQQSICAIQHKRRFVRDATRSSQIPEKRWLESKENSDHHCWHIRWHL